MSSARITAKVGSIIIAVEKTKFIENIKQEIQPHLLSVNGTDQFFTKNYTGFVVGFVVV